MNALVIRTGRGHGEITERMSAPEVRESAPARTPFWILRWAFCFSVSVGLAFCTAPSSAADETADPKSPRGPRMGRLLRVSAPISSGVTARVTNAAMEFIAGAKRQGKWPIVIFEFEPGKSDFEDALKLANRIAQISGATTVAYVANDANGDPQRLRGHAVLAALACDQLALHPDAWIGEADAFEEQPGAVMKTAYAEVARNHGPISEDLAVSLLDPSLEIKSVELPEEGRAFASVQRIVELKKTMTVIVKEKWVEPGKTGLLSGLDFVSMGLMDQDNLVKNRSELALALGLSPEAVEDDPFWNEAPRAVIFPIIGTLKPGVILRIQDKIRSKIDEDDTNLIIFEINSAGGVPEESMNLANYLAGALISSKRRTVAYVTSQAAGDAAFIAMACDHVVLLPEAVLGGLGSLSEDDVKVHSGSLAAIARQKGRSGSLASALIDPSIVVYRYDRVDGEVDAYFTEDEQANQHDPARWLKRGPVTEKGHPLTLEAERARELRLATNVVQSYDDLKEFYALTYDPERITFDWLDFILAALARKEVLAGLLMIGMVAFYAEMHSPGVGVGGLIATCCFLLYFWGNFLEGRADWLEILMFLIGLVLILLEVFVIPGFGVIGIGGGILLLLSIVMAMQTFRGIPSTEREIIELRDSLATITFAAIGALFGAMMLRRYLPVTPGLSGLVLSPSASADGDPSMADDTALRFDHLVGELGVAVTQLTPSGKARVGNQILDVVTDGEVIERGEMVRVIQTQGNRIVVQASR